ncbi:CS1 type fimbrial major subunit [compost metagenome]
MSALKKLVLAPFAVAALAVSVQAMAAKDQHTIQLEATIPSLVFHVQPVDGSWIPVTQTLQYSSATDSLDTLRKEFYAKHTAGTIEASVLNTPALQNISGTETIDLNVSFNNKALSSTPVEVVTETDAGLGVTAWLEIQPVKPAAGYVAGTYEGNVQLAFDAVVAP